MPTTIAVNTTTEHLRKEAESHLLEGTSPASSGWAIGVDALSLLHRLSSNPDSADDALKLLHELQVYQVELDLQNHSMTAREQELTDELRLYQDMYDAAPFGYFLISLDGKIIEANFVAAELFAVPHDELAGRPIDSFLRGKSRPLLLDLLQQVAHSGRSDSCLAATSRGLEGSRNLYFMASSRPGHPHILLACYQCNSPELPH